MGKLPLTIVFYHCIKSNWHSFGIFYGPCSGILVADFWIVRKRRVKSRYFPFAFYRDACN